MAFISGLPRTNVLTDLKNYITREWDQWMQVLVQIVNATSPQVARQDVAGTAAIATVDMLTPRLSGGLYRYSYSIRETRAATASSALQLTLGWTSNSTPQTFVGTNLTGNSLSTQDNRSQLIHVDDGTTVSYSTAYTSVGPTTMTYDLNLTLDMVP